MSDRKLTLLELHFDEGFQIGPETVGLGGDGEDDTTDEGDTTDENDTAGEDDTGGPRIDTDRGGGRVRTLVAAALALAVAAAVARRLRDDDAVEIETPDGEDVEEFESAE
jgi:hypothetical protein